jgi:hypothetical protein
MRSPVEALLHGADTVREVLDELAEALRRVACLRRVDLVPQIPGEQRARAAPAPRREGEPRLDGVPRLRTEQQARRVVEHAAVGTVVGMMAPVQPGPVGVEGREQDAQPEPLADREEVVPQLHHPRHEGAERPLEVAVARLRVLHHEPDAGHAAVGEALQVRFRPRQVTPAVEALQRLPADRVVVADGRPGLPRLVDEVRRVRGDADPRQSAGLATWRRRRSPDRRRGAL